MKNKYKGVYFYKNGENFRLPLYKVGEERVCFIDERELLKAKKIGFLFCIKIEGKFSYFYDPDLILKKGKKMEKVFKFENNPMRLVGWEFEILPDDVQERIEYDPYWQTIIFERLSLVKTK